jgi:uncharacterized protein
MKYKRSVFLQLKKYLKTEEIVLLTGARQIGKTTLLHQIESKLKLEKEIVFFLNLEDPEYLELLNQSPKNLFSIFPINPNKKTYLLVDEVQYLNNPSNFLKYLFDQYHGKLKIIASGSSAFYLDQKFKDSLAGRKKIINLYTLSFKEFLNFKSIANIPTNFRKLTLSEKDFLQPLLNEYLLWGGYPKVVLANNQREKKEQLKELVYSYIKKDIFEAYIRQDEVFLKFLKILASQTGNLVNSNELSRTLGVSKSATDNYLAILQKSFHIRLVKPFSKNIRKELTKMPKVYFLDFGLKNYLLNNFSPISTRLDLGQIVENAVFRLLIDKFDTEQVRYWRTINGHEVDFVVATEGMAYEVKADAKQVKTQKYKLFEKEYPNFKLNFATLDNLFQLME